MQITGIIAEYNPFHNGHAYQITEARKNASHIVAVMSGNYVQRGEPALLSKRTRAEMALRNGVDLVLELPTPWAMSTAQNFALGGISLLGALGCVDGLSFGCETAKAYGDETENLLLSAANAINSSLLKPYLDNYLSKGMGFACARESAVRDVFGDKTADILTHPNDILAVEYIAAANKFGSKFNLYPVCRAGAEHDSESEDLSPYLSASQIRKMISADEFDLLALSLPPSVKDLLIQSFHNGNIINSTKFETAIMSRLRIMTAEDFARLPDISEGLENRLFESVKKAANLSEFFYSAKTKRYSHARLRRIVWSAFIGLTNDFFGKSIPYARVLGLTENGKEILKKAKRSSAIPIILRPRDIDNLDPFAKALFDTECRATDLFWLAAKNPRKCGTEYTDSVIIT